MIRFPIPVFAPEGVAGGASGGSADPAPSGGSSPPNSSTPSGASDTSPAGGTPSPDTPSGSPPSGQPEDFFSGFLENDDGNLDSPSQPDGQEPQQPDQAQPAPQEPAQPQPQPQQPYPQPAPGPQGDLPPPPSPAEPGQMALELLYNEQQFTDQLAQTMFALTPEDREALETDAPAHIPKLLARAYFKGTANFYRALQEHVPAMITKEVGKIRRSMQNENKFWGRWPQLDRVKHEQVLARYAPIYRQANPSATLEQMVDDLGPLVAQAVGVSLAQPPGAYRAAGNGPQPRPVAMTPFRPAMSGPASVPQPQNDDPWSALGQDYSEQE